MKCRSLRRLALIARWIAIAGLAGCGSGGPETDYGLSRGTSLNGTAAFAEMLRGRGFNVRAAVRLTDELAEWSAGLVRFAPYPGPPEADEAKWYTDWLEEDPDRWLIYVVRDFDTAAEYWKQIRDAISESDDPERRAQAEENRSREAGWVTELPEKPKKTGDAREWFGVEPGAGPPKVCTQLGGPWAQDVDASAAAVWLHEAIARGAGTVLLEGDGLALVVDKSAVGRPRVLIVANGSFLLNEALVNASRRRLALEVAGWPDRETDHVAFVEGTFVLGGEEATPSLWKLLERLPALKWVAVQMAVAALFAALARAPRLGRPRPDPPSGADRPAAHAEALGALLEASRATKESLDLLDRYRVWRRGHAARVPARRGGRARSGLPATVSGPAPLLAASGAKEPAEKSPETA